DLIVKVLRRAGEVICDELPQRWRIRQIGRERNFRIVFLVKPFAEAFALLRPTIHKTARITGAQMQKQFLALRENSIGRLAKRAVFVGVVILQNAESKGCAAHNKTLEIVKIKKQANSMVSYRVDLERC